jgi:hypothetical protein
MPKSAFRGPIAGWKVVRIIRKLVQKMRVNVLYTPAYKSHTCDAGAEHDPTRPGLGQGPVKIMYGDWEIGFDNFSWRLVRWAGR